MSYVQYGYRMRSPEEVFFDLQRYVGFTKADLEANRRGALTGRQRKALVGEMASPCVRFAMALLAFLAWYFVPPDSFEFLEEMDHDQLLLVPVLLLGYALFQTPWSTLADVLSPHVETAEGKGDVEMRGVNDHVSLDDRRKEWGGDEESTEAEFNDWEDSQQLYHLRVDGVRFPASKQVVNSIEEGHRYRAFYLRHSHELLSIEPVPDNVNPPIPQPLQ